MSLQAPRSLVPVVLVLLLELVAFCLMAVALFFCVKPMWMDTSRENVCVGADRTECYVEEPGFVAESGDDAITVAHGFPGVETTVVASRTWDDEPRDRARVVLQYWEGAEEVAYVYEPPAGPRHGTSDAPDRGSGVGGIVLLLIVGGIVSTATFSWLRGY